MKTVPLNTAFRDLGKYISRNSPSIITGLGIGLGVASTVLAVIVTPKAVQLLAEKKKEEQKEKLTVIETIKTAGTCYIPAVLAAAGSIYCIVSASAKFSKRNAILATAYALSERDLREYRDKVKETVGEKKEKEIRGKIAKDHILSNPAEPNRILTPEGGKTLCYDNWTGRYFMSDMESLRRCENELNSRVLKEQFVSLNELYDLLHLEGIKMGEDFGWNYDGFHDELIHFSYFSQLDRDGNPCLVLDYDAEPFDIYQRVGH